MTNQTRGCYIALAAFALLVAAAVECPAKTVRLQLKWKHQFQFAGYYAAVEQGYFEQAGLDVQLVEYPRSGSVVDSVASGMADYGVAGPEVLLAVMNGAQLTIVAAVMQHSPSVLLTMSDNRLYTPYDLAGKRIMLSPDGEADLWSMLHNEGVTSDDFILAPPTWDIEALISGQVDAMAAYVTNTPYELIRRGLGFHAINPRSYGVDFYGDCFFTSQQEVREHPERVRAMRDAIIKGWEYALENPDAVIDLILQKYGSDKSREHLEYEARTMQGLIRPELIAIGHMSTGRWRAIAETYVTLGMADPVPSLENHIYDLTAPREPPVWLDTLLIGLAIAAAVAAVAAVWLLSFNRSLRRAVQRRTAELYRVNQEMTQEVAERRKAERAIRESETRYRSLASHFPNGAVVLFDSQLRFLLADGLGLKDVELSSDLMQGKTLHEVFDADMCSVMEPSMLSALDGKESMQELLYMNRVYEVRSIPVRSGEGKEHFGLIMAQDVTPRVEAEKVLRQDRDELEKRVQERTRKLDTSNELLSREIEKHKETLRALRTQEERLEQIIRTTPVGVCITREDHVIEYVNPAYCRMYGYMPEELVNKKYEEVMSPEHRSKVQDMQAKFAAGQVEVAGEYAVRDKQGRPMTVLANATVTPAIEGGRRRVIFAVDITDRKVAEQELRAAKEKAEQSDQMKSQFLAIMSHELRTPLNGVIGLAQLVEPCTEEQQEYLDAILSSSRKLLRTLNDILEYARIESGAATLREEPFSLAEMVRTSVEAYRKEGGAKGLSLQWSIAPDTPEVFLGDEGVLGRVLSNLLQNAVKFTEKGSVEVFAACVEVCRLPEAVDADVYDQQLIFAVRDSGVGVTKEAQKFIFEAFSQGSNVYTRIHGGTGLGLAVCHRLVSLMRGSIDLESEPGRGSLFTFTVTLATPKEMNEILPSGAPLAKQPGASPEGSLRVLVADRNKINADHVQGVLHCHGHETARADSLPAALELLQTGHFDAALVDMALPDEKGRPPVETIREAMDPSALVAAMSAYVDAAAPDGGPVLAKPVHAHELGKLLAAAQSS